MATGPNLSARDQAILAGLLAAIRGGVAAHIDADTEAAAGAALNRLGAACADWCDRHGVTPQEIDGLYDRLHRTGAQA